MAYWFQDRSTISVLNLRSKSLYFSGMLNIVLISRGWFPLQKKWNQNETIIHSQIRYLRRQDLNLVIRSPISFFFSIQNLHQTLAQRKLCQISLWLKIRAFGCRGSKALFLGKVTFRGIPRDSHQGIFGTATLGPGIYWVVVAQVSVQKYQFVFALSLVLQLNLWQQPLFTATSTQDYLQQSHSCMPVLKESGRNSITCRD